MEFVKVYAVRHQLPPLYFDSPKSLYPWLQRLMMEYKLDPATFLLDKDRGHYEKNVKPLQWKPEEQSMSLSDMRKAMLPEEAILVGPGRKGQEKCAVIVEGGRVLGYTYFYLSTDRLNRAQLKAHGRSR